MRNAERVVPEPICKRMVSLAIQQNQLAAMAGGENAGEGSDDAESDWGGTASDVGSSNSGSRVSVVDVQTA